MGVSFIGKWLTMADRFPKVPQSCDVPPVQLLAVCIIGILFLKSPLMTIARVWKSKNIQEAYLAICNELFHDMSFFFSNMPPNCNQIMSNSSFSHHFPTIFPAFPHKKVAISGRQARCAVWVAQYVVPSARGRGLDQRMCLDSTDPVDL